MVSSTAFATAALLMVGSREAQALLVGISVIAAVLIVFGIALFRDVFQVPHDPAQSSPSEGRRLMRQFGTIVAVEGLALTAVTLACVLNRRWALIAPLDLIVVGLHFLPLARLFAVPRYNITAALFCAIPVATMMLIPVGGRIGEALGWFVVPSVGCAAVASTTAWAGLREVRRFVVAVRSHGV